jgi:ketosteroid isomerase-like protein
MESIASGRIPAVSTETTTADLVNQLWDIEQIKQLKARYFRLMDTRDWNAWIDVFTDDVAVHIDDPAAEVRCSGRDQMLTLAQGITPGISTHHGHTPEIALVDAEHATGIWAMFDYVQTPATNEHPLGLQGYGHYHETYRKTDDGQWRIATLRLTRLRVDATAYLD